MYISLYDIIFYAEVKTCLMFLASLVLAMKFPIQLTEKLSLFFGEPVSVQYQQTKEHYYFNQVLILY